MEQFSFACIELKYSEILLSQKKCWQAIHIIIRGIVSGRLDGLTSPVLKSHKSVVVQQKEIAEHKATAQRQTERISKLEKEVANLRRSKSSRTCRIITS